MSSGKIHVIGGGSEMWDQFIKILSGALEAPEAEGPRETCDAYKRLTDRESVKALLEKGCDCNQPHCPGILANWTDTLHPAYGDYLIAHVMQNLHSAKVHEINDKDELLTKVTDIVVSTTERFFQ